MTENAICHDCNNGIVGRYRAQPVFCICPTGLDAEMAFVSKHLNDVTEARQALIDAGLTDRAQSIEMLRLELEAEHDALEAEWTERRAE